MILRKLLEATGAGIYVRVGTERGESWVLYGKVIDIIAGGAQDDLMERKVINIWPVEEHRNKNAYACELEPGLAILVEGYENGIY